MFLRECKQLRENLGAEFFAHFKKNFIDTSETATELMTQEALTAMRAMIATFSQRDTLNQCMLWQQLTAKHIATTEWASLDNLWQGFKAFNHYLKRNQLVLKSEVVCAIPVGNMLVWFGRMQQSIERIPGSEEQQAFLNGLVQFDLSYGGVHHAIREGANHFDAALMFSDFHLGSPTYAPQPKTLYEWPKAESALYHRRLLAFGGYRKTYYETLCARFANDEETSKHALALLLATQFDRENTACLDTIERMLATKNGALIARHLYQAKYEHGANSAVDLIALAILSERMETHNLEEVLMQNQQGTFLEAVSILAEKNACDDLKKLHSCFMKYHKQDASSLLRQGLKLVALFQTFEDRDVGSLANSLAKVHPAAQNELTILFTQLLSIDLQKTDKNKLKNPALWAELLDCINNSKRDLAHASRFRQELIQRFTQYHHIAFQYSAVGDYRLLNQSDYTIAIAGALQGYQEQGWNFLKAHVAIPATSDRSKALQPVLDIISKMIHKRGWLDETGLLFAALNKAAREGEYWSAEQLANILACLQLPEEKIAPVFRASLLDVFLQSQLARPRSLSSVTTDFPKAFFPLVREHILRRSDLNSKDQANLCRILLIAYEDTRDAQFFKTILATLNNQHPMMCTYLLAALSQAENANELTLLWEKACWLLEHKHKDLSLWTDVCSYYFAAFKEPHIIRLLHKIEHDVDVDKEGLILEIIAFTSLKQRRVDHVVWSDALTDKVNKLITHLQKLSKQELTLLASNVCVDPRPNTSDMLRLIKRSKHSDVTWDTLFVEFRRNPHLRLRQDYGTMGAMREVDLARLLNALHISENGENHSISIAQRLEILQFFDYLQKIEEGVATISMLEKSVHELTPEELQCVFEDAGRRNREETSVKTQTELFAIMAEAMERATGEPLNLAQKFAFIVNRRCVSGKRSGFTLGMGEGKTRVAACEAGYHVSRGKKVDSCTANRVLAKEAYEENKRFYALLGISSACINASSTKNEYEAAAICHTTVGELSLLFDRLCLSQQMGTLSLEDRVGLFDEFDYIRYVEELNTQYRLAGLPEYTSEELTWCREVANTFYDNHRKKLISSSQITDKDLQQFASALQKCAGTDETKIDYLKKLVADPLCLVELIQASHAAYELKLGKHFFLQRLMVEINGQLFPMRKIVPLSSDNQALSDSTFSEDVHQQRAVRINSRAKRKGKAKDVHVPAKSPVSSSKTPSVCMELWGESQGFTATLSAKQIAEIPGMQVAHIDSNRLSLRFFHEPRFYKNDKIKLNAVVAQMRNGFAKTESILIVCKDDRSVGALKKKLFSLLNDQERAQCLFWTNAQDKTTQERLTEKNTKENRQNGVAQKAVAVVGASVSRGHNLNVKAVFIMEPTDETELLQQAGRTARNGEDGEVFQFYSNRDLYKEYRILREQADALGQEINVNKMFGIKSDALEGRDLLRIVLALREYVKRESNIATSTYQKLLAQFCAWGLFNIMNNLNAENVKVMRLIWDQQLVRIDRAWIDILSSSKKNPEQKIAAIRTEIEKCAEYCNTQYEQYCGKKAPALECQLLKAPAVIADPDFRDSSFVVTAICLHLTRLGLFTWEDNACYQLLPEQLKQLDREKSHVLLKRLKTLTSIDEALSFVATIASDDYVVDQDVQKHSQTLQAYLDTFSQEETQAQWRADFENAQDFILAQTSEEELLAVRVAVPPMRLHHFQAIWAFANRYAENVADLLTLINETMQKDPELRIRALTTCEQLASNLQNKKRKQDFIRDFVDVMHRFNGMWDTFALLLKLTERTWVKNEGVYQEELLLLWQRLSKLPQENRMDIKSLIDLCLQQSRTLGFQSLLICFNLGNSHIGKSASYLLDVMRQIDVLENTKKIHKKSMLTLLVSFLEDGAPLSPHLIPLAHRLCVAVQFAEEKIKTLLPFCQMYPDCVSLLVDTIHRGTKWECIRDLVPAAKLSVEQMKVLLSRGLRDSFDEEKYNDFINDFVLINTFLEKLDNEDDIKKMLVAWFNEGINFWFDGDRLSVHDLFATHATKLLNSPQLLRQLACIDEQSSVSMTFKLNFLKQYLHEENSTELNVKLILYALSAYKNEDELSGMELTIAKLIYLVDEFDLNKILAMLRLFLKHDGVFNTASEWVSGVFNLSNRDFQEKLTKVRPLFFDLTLLGVDDQLESFLPLFSGENKTTSFKLLSFAKNFFSGNDLVMFIRQFTAITSNTSKDALMTFFEKNSEKFIRLRRFTWLLQILEMGERDFLLKLSMIDQFIDHFNRWKMDVTAFVALLPESKKEIARNEKRDKGKEKESDEKEKEQDHKGKERIVEDENDEMAALQKRYVLFADFMSLVKNKKNAIHLARKFNACTQRLDFTQATKLLRLCECSPKHCHTILEPAIVQYLLNKVVAGEETLALQLITRFQKMANREPAGDQEQIATWITMHYFDFEDRDQDKSRTLLLHMLNRGIFIREPDWTKEKNDGLLKACFSKYTEETSRILERKEPKQRAGNLSIAKHHDLIQLTDELHVVGKRRYSLVQNAQNMNLLHKHVNKVLNQYRHTGFWICNWHWKSQARKENAAELQRALEDIKYQQRHEKDKSYYELILAKIDEQKYAAMDEDYVRNRRSSRKQNRSGKSEYFETLNKMRQLVLTAWAKDASVLQDMCRYREYMHKDIETIAAKLLQELGALNDPRYTRYKAEYSEIGASWKEKRGPSLFKRNNEKEEALWKLETFCKVILKTQAQDEKSMHEILFARRYENVLTGSLSNKLPGHIRALVNELKRSTDALTWRAAEKNRQAYELVSLK